MANLIKTIATRVTKAITNMAAMVKASTILSWSAISKVLFPDIDQRSAIDDNYAANTILYSVVNMDAEKFASVPRYLYDAKAMQEEKKNSRIVEGANYDLILKLLSKPNPTQSQSEFFELTRIFYKCCGESFIWLNRGDVKEKYVAPYINADGNYIEGGLIERTNEEIDAMPVLEMYCFPPGWVGVIPDPDNIFSVLGYWLDTGNGMRKYIRKGDMIHWKRQNPVYNPFTGSHLRGLSPFQVGKETIQENKDQIASSVRMFKNDGAKGFMYNEGLNWFKLTEPERQQIKDTVDGRINGHDAKGAVAMLGGKWGYNSIAQSSIDMNLLEARKFTWQEISFLTKVPYELFDNKNTYANRLEAQKGWVSNTIGPACKSLDEKLTEALSKSFKLEGRVIILSDLDSLPEMKLDIAALITALKDAWYISPNRKLVMLGHEPENNELFNEPWVPDGITPLSQISNETNFQNAVNLNPGVKY